MWADARRLLLALILAILSSAGCKTVEPYACTSSSTCSFEGQAGTCEPTGFCSFPDGSCSGGRRYGEYSGPHSNECVGEATTDGGVQDACGADLDCDGVDDDHDNCPSVPNPGQENEDGDRFGDACDPCPPIADDNPPDTDGDLVADACDPNPTTPGDVIVLFEGFSSPIPPTWDSTGGWSIQSGDAVVDTTGHANLGIPFADATREVATGSVTITATNGGTPQNAGIDLLHVSGADVAIDCEIYLTGGTPAPGLALNNLAASPIQEVGYEMTVGTTYTFRLARNGNQFDCSSDNGTSSAVTSGSTSLANLGQLAGLRVVSAGAKYHWLMIVRSP